MIETVGTQTRQCFQLKGGLFTLTTLQLMTLDLKRFSEELSLKKKEAPNFFKHTPVVIDMVSLNSIQGALDFQELRAIIQAHSLVPVGLKGGRPDQQEAAKAVGLAILPEKKSSAPSKDTESRGNNTPSTLPQETLESHLSPTRPGNSQLVTQPVRSGQQIYARGGDLIVYAPVSSGAELLADGHIHIYNTLRGRALAGVQGDTSARIFCKQLEAELVSIAGFYQLNEQLRLKHWQKSVCIQLSEDHLQINEM